MKTFPVSLNRLRLVGLVSVLVLGTALGIPPANEPKDIWYPIGPWGADVGRVVIDAGNPDILYASIHDVGIYRSTDAGTTWALTSQGIDLDVRPMDGELIFLTADPVNPGVVYVGTSKVSPFSGDGIFKTTDYGQTWTRLSGFGIGKVFGLAIDPTNPSTVYVYGAERHTIATDFSFYRSTDGGFTWTALVISAPEFGFRIAMLVDPTNPQVIYAGNSISRTGGVTWEEKIPAHRSIAAAPSLLGFVFVAADQGVYRSTDRGLTWAPSNLGLAPAAVQDVAVHPAGGAVYVWQNGLYKSVNRGLSWSRQGPDVPGTFNSMVLDPAHQGTLYVSTADRSVFKSTDDGASWKPSLVGLGGATLSFVAPDPQTPGRVYALGQDLTRLDNYGAESRVILSPSPFNRLRIDRKDPLLLYAWLKDAQNIQISQDGGAKWTPVTGLPAAAKVRDLQVDPTNAGHAYLGADTGLYKTTARGATWNKLADYAVESLAIAPSDPEILVLVTLDSVYKSPDGGQTWQKLSVAAPPSQTDLATLAIDPLNPNVLYVGGWKSEDGGQSWVRMMSLGFTVVLVQAIDPTDTHVLYGQADNWLAAVFRSTDGGASWSPHDPGLPVSRVFAVTGDPHTPGALYAATPAGVQRFVPSLASWLHFPYLKETAASFTGFAVGNFSGNQNRLSFTGYDGEGRPAAVPDNPASFVLGPNQQLARLGHEIFAEQGADLDGWISARGDFDAGGFFLFAGDKWADGAVGESEDSSVLYFSRALQGAGAYLGQDVETTLVLVNPADKPVTVSLTRMGSSGEFVGGSVSRTIPPKGRLEEKLDTLFTRPISEGYIRLFSANQRGVIGFELVRFPSKQSAFGLNALHKISLGRAYSAQLAQMAGTRTRVNLINTSKGTMKVRLKAISDTGSLLAPEVETTLAPGASLEKDTGELFGFSPSADVVGSLDVTADQTGLIGDVVFGEMGTLQKIAALPLQTEPLKEMVFSQVANGMGYYNGIALFNPGMAANQVTISVYSAEGALTGQAQLTLAPGARLARLLPELIPSTEGQIRGSIHITATQPLVAQELFGTADFLAAVPGLAVRD